MRIGRSSRPAAGTRWNGPLCYNTDPEIGRPGFYGLDEEGKMTLDPPVLLTHVDEAPGDPEDGSEHWVVADEDKPYYSHAPNEPLARTVELQSEVAGEGGVNVG